MEKDKRIKNEITRLNRLFKNIDDNKKNTVVGLIQRAAYLRITLEDFEVDLDEKGFVEWFKQGKDQDPYERKRPVADLYNTMNTSYQKAIKQLTDLLPKDNGKATEAVLPLDRDRGAIKQIADKISENMQPNNDVLAVLVAMMKEVKESNTVLKEIAGSKIRWNDRELGRLIQSHI